MRALLPCPLITDSGPVAGRPLLTKQLQRSAERNRQHFVSEVALGIASIVVNGHVGIEAIVHSPGSLRSPPSSDFSARFIWVARHVRYPDIEGNAAIGSLIVGGLAFDAVALIALVHAPQIDPERSRERHRGAARSQGSVVLNQIDSAQKSVAVPGPPSANSNVPPPKMFTLW
jgi:hypothetical protein